MALATVNIDKIVKVTSASSYVYCKVYSTEATERYIPVRLKNCWTAHTHSSSQPCSRPYTNHLDIGLSNQIKSNRI